MSTTSYMNLSLPTVSTTLGPEWATQINEAFETIDVHDHSTEKGVKITPAGLNINEDLSFGNSRATSVKSSQYQNLTATLTGASHATSIYVVDGNLYYTNAAGTAVQITTGSAIVSSPGAVESFQRDDFSTDLTISASDPYVFIGISSAAAAREVVLPAASAVTVGRIYIIADTAGTSETNAITITADGSDLINGESEYVINSNGSAIFLTGNGVSKWQIS